MNTVFTGKNSIQYAIDDLNQYNILNKTEILEMYSMQELDALYKKYYGNYIFMYKPILLKKIEVYDSSDDVNCFIFRGSKVWLDKATRVGLMHLANCSTTDMQLVLGNQILTFPPESVKEFLARLEVYAGQCYLQTQQHLINAQQLTNIDDIINYDYTTGYPDKIVLE